MPEMIETYLPSIFGDDALAERLGAINARRFTLFPEKAVVHLVRDSQGQQVFVYSFISRLGVEVWVLPAAEVPGNPETGGNNEAWWAFQDKLAGRGEQFKPGYEHLPNRTSDGEDYPVLETALAEMREVFYED